MSTAPPNADGPITRLPARGIVLVAAYSDFREYDALIVALGKNARGTSITASAALQDHRGANELRALHDRLEFNVSGRELRHFYDWHNNAVGNPLFEKVYIKAIDVLSRLRDIESWPSPPGSEPALSAFLHRTIAGVSIHGVVRVDPKMIAHDETGVLATKVGREGESVAVVSIPGALGRRVVFTIMWSNGLAVGPVCECCAPSHEHYSIHVHVPGQQNMTTRILGFLNEPYTGGMGRDWPTYYFRGRVYTATAEECAALCAATECDHGDLGMLLQAVSIAGDFACGDGESNQGRLWAMVEEVFTPSECDSPAGLDKTAALSGSYPVLPPNAQRYDAEWIDAISYSPYCDVEQDLDHVIRATDLDYDRREEVYDDSDDDGDEERRPWTGGESPRGLLAATRRVLKDVLTNESCERLSTLCSALQGFEGKVRLALDGGGAGPRGWVLSAAEEQACFAQEREAETARRVKAQQLEELAPAEEAGPAAITIKIKSAVQAWAINALNLYSTPLRLQLHHLVERVDLVPHHSPSRVVVVAAGPGGARERVHRHLVRPLRAADPLLPVEAGLAHGGKEDALAHRGEHAGPVDMLPDASRPPRKPRRRRAGHDRRRTLLLARQECGSGGGHDAQPPVVERRGVGRLARDAQGGFRFCGLLPVVRENDLRVVPRGLEPQQRRLGRTAPPFRGLLGLARRARLWPGGRCRVPRLLVVEVRAAGERVQERPVPPPQRLRPAGQPLGAVERPQGRVGPCPSRPPAPFVKERQRPAQVTVELAEAAEFLVRRA